MFDENFSFRSSREVPPPVNIDDCESAEISPFNSRCSSPKYFEQSFRQQSLPRRDSRFDIYRTPRHPSVNALTAQLEHHAIDDLSRPESPLSVTSPDFMDQDEGFYDSPDTPSTNYSEDSDFDPTLWDLSHMGATSSPSPSLSLEAQAHSSYTQRRRQRQALVRLQCLAKRAPDIAMLIEECHPSSLPFASETLCNTSRSSSTISLGATSNPSRIEKAPSSSVRKQVKMRKRSTR